MFRSIDPTNNQEVAGFEMLSNDDLNKHLDISANRFRTDWKRKPVEERSAVIWAISQKLERDKDRLAKLITLEMGKPYKQSIAEVKKCAWLCKYVAENGAEILKTRLIKGEGLFSKVFYQPLGVILGIMPWNFPLWQAFRFGIPAMMAGNTVVLKPASNVPQCGRAIEELISSLTKEGVFQTLFISEEQVKLVLGHDAVQGVALTGSARAGASVASTAGSNIKKSVLELGGSDAFVVLEDADVMQAARVAVKSRMNNSGQTCIAAKRFIVVEKVADLFIEEVKNNFMRLEMGDPMEERTDIGPLARPDLLDKLEQQVQDSIKMGAKVLIDGGRTARPGNFFRPICLSEVKKGMPAYDEELFGPVATIFRAKDEEQAIELANDTPYGLGASVWTRDLGKAESVALSLEAGAVSVNEMVKSDPRVPFGGIKKSGYGRELADTGMKEFINQKSVVLPSD